MVISPPGGTSRYIINEFWKITMTSWQRSIVTFYLGCMVSEITRFYCKPDMTMMTSSWLLCQGALQAIFKDEFWKSYHDFLIVFHSDLFIWDAWFPRLRGSNASRIWRHHDSSARGRFRRFYMTDSERANVTSWQCSIVTFNLGCMVSELTRFYCMLDITSSWFRS